MKIIKSLIKKLAIRFISQLNHNSIVFESYPDLSDNSMGVFDEMIRRGLNEKYHMVWVCHGKGPFPIIPNTEYIRYEDMYGKKLFWKTLKACCLVSCNSFLCSRTNYQKAIYVMHGIGLKKANTYKPGGKLDYITGLSDGLNQMIARELNVSSEIMRVTGYPRNDVLLKSSRETINGLFDREYKKIIVWYPTFRQHAHGCIQDSKITIPIIHDIDNAVRINDVAKATNTLIVLKPHYAQNVSIIKDLGLGNIKIINDDFYNEHNITSYEFVGACDALITDYSSIYFDYLLCDKPIAAIWEDIEEYRNNRGFAVDIDYYMKGAFKIYTRKDFENFINAVSEDCDEMRNEREIIKNEVHFYKDDKSASRVVDFIEHNILKTK